VRIFDRNAVAIGELRAQILDVLPLSWPLRLQTVGIAIGRDGKIQREVRPTRRGRANSRHRGLITTHTTPGNTFLASWSSGSDRPPSR